MKVKIDDIIDAVDFDSDMSESFLNTKTEQVCMFTDEELRAAENDVDYLILLSGIVKRLLVPNII